SSRGSPSLLFPPWPTCAAALLDRRALTHSASVLQSQCAIAARSRTWYGFFRRSCGLVKHDWENIMRMWAGVRACIVGAAAILCAGGTGHTQDPVRIGVLLPVTGPFAKNGIENWEAMQIARDLINAQGGINGRKVEYLLGDATSPNAAISETERLITKD